MGFVQIFLYGTSCGLFGLTFYVLLHDSVNPVALAYGSHFQYLTILGLLVTFVAQIVGLAGSITGCSKLMNAKDKLNILAAPLALLISILYWSIKFFDHTLLLDPKIQIIPPMWLDLCMHAIPSIVEMIDVLYFGKLWSMSVVQVSPLFAFFASGYWWWVHHTYYKNGFFPYPMLDLVTTAQRAQIFLVATLIVCFSYQVIKVLQAGVRQQDKLKQKVN